MFEFYLVKVLFFATLAFMFAFLATPLLTHYLYKYKLGKKIRNNGATPVFSELHAHKEGTPTMGGILIWGIVLLLILLFSIFPSFFPGEI
jgi:phospho-N-acetylmuramoyl-pentapeptide-transferase